jgi:hypothetical protein
MSSMIQPSGPYGGLVVYYNNAGITTTIYALDAKGNRSQTYYAETQKIQTDSGQTVYVALFPNMNPGNYEVCKPGFSASTGKKITVFPAAVAEVRF